MFSFFIRYWYSSGLNSLFFHFVIAIHLHQMIVNRSLWYCWISQMSLVSYINRLILILIPALLNLKFHIFIQSFQFWRKLFIGKMLFHRFLYLRFHSNAFRLNRIRIIIRTLLYTTSFIFIQPIRLWWRRIETTFSTLKTAIRKFFKTWYI